MNINFNFMIFNNLYDNKAAAVGSIAGALSAVSNKGVKALNMDSLSLSGKFASEINKMSETLKLPKELDKAVSTDDLIAEGKEISGIDGVAKAQGQALQKAYAAKGGINRVMGIIEEMQEVVDRLNGD